MSVRSYGGHRAKTIEVIREKDIFGITVGGVPYPGIPGSPHNGLPIVLLEDCEEEVKLFPKTDEGMRAFGRAVDAYNSRDRSLYQAKIDEDTEAATRYRALRDARSGSRPARTPPTRPPRNPDTDFGAKI